MHGDFPSVVLVPTVIKYLVTLCAATALWCVVDVRLRSRRAPEGRSRGVLRPTTVLWVLPFVLILAFLALWCALGLYDGDGAATSLAVRVTLACGVLTLPRNRVAEALSGRFCASPSAGAAHFADGAATRAQRPAPLARVLHAVFAAVALAGCAYAAHLALELPWNDAVFDMDPRFSRLECAVIALVLVALYLVFQHHGAGPAVGVVAFFVIGLAQHFVIMFKGSSILPSDLLVLDTAAEVSGGYVYSIGAGCALALAALAPALLACAYLLPLTSPGRGRTREARVAAVRRVGVNLGCAAACVVALAVFVSVPSWREDFGVHEGYWNTIHNYQLYGFLPAFVVGSQELPIEVPEGYAEAAAEELEASYAAAYDAASGQARAEAVAQFEELKPTVIVVMNESFSDLSVYENIRDAGYEGPVFLKTGLTDALSSGPLAVSVLGGGTCNSEFEFLTGTSMAFVGFGKYPYVFYNYNDVDTLVRQFADLGYATTAIHPNVASNWQRGRVYEQMGFDRFLDISDVPEGAENLHAGVRDSVTYDMILDLLEEDDSPQFVFDVTMQNHSGYSTDGLSDDIVTNYEVEGGDDGQLNGYLSLINSSDADLEAFVSELRELDRPVVLVFFGDHQPALAADFNDAYYTDESDVDHIEREYQTVYTIWANYDVAGSDQAGATDGTSAAYLAAQLMDLIGAPLTDWQKEQLMCRDGLPSYDVFGYQDAAGSWHDLDETGSAASSLLEDLRWGSYLEFGSKV